MAKLWQHICLICYCRWCCRCCCCWLWRFIAALIQCFRVMWAIWNVFHSFFSVLLGYRIFYPLNVLLDESALILCWSAFKSLPKFQFDAFQTFVLFSCWEYWVLSGYGCMCARHEKPHSQQNEWKSSKEMLVPTLERQKSWEKIAINTYLNIIN